MLFCFLFLIWGVCLTHPVLALFLSGEFLLHIPCFFFFFFFAFVFLIWGVSLTHPVLALFLSGEFLLHIPCLLFFFFFFFFFFSVGSFSYKSHAGFIFLWGRFPTYPMLTLLLCGEFLLHIPCCLQFYAGSFSYTSWAGFISYTSRAAFFFFFFFFFKSGEFLLHIPCWLYFSVGSFSYTPHACFIFIWGVSLTHPVLASYSCGEFL